MWLLNILPEAIKGFFSQEVDFDIELGEVVENLVEPGDLLFKLISKIIDQILSVLKVYFFFDELNNLVLECHEKGFRGQVYVFSDFPFDDKLGFSLVDY